MAVFPLMKRDPNPLFSTLNIADSNVLTVLAMQCSYYCMQFSKTRLYITPHIQRSIWRVYQ